MSANKCFNLVNPLSWFLLEDHAKTTPSPSGTDLKVKPMLGGRASRAHTNTFTSKKTYDIL